MAETYEQYRKANMGAHAPLMAKCGHCRLKYFPIVRETGAEMVCPNPNCRARTKQKEARE